MARRLEKGKSAAARIRPALRHASWLSCLNHLYGELGRLTRGMETLEEYQQEILQGLEEGVDEQAAAFMHEWWDYDGEALHRRAEGGRPAKPRIDVTLGIGQRGHLSVEWRPTGTHYDSAVPGCDWQRWHRHRAYSRPSSELLLIRRVGFAERRLRRDQEPLDDLLPAGRWRQEMLANLQDLRREYRRIGRAIDAMLLQATAGLVGQLKTRLRHSFDVTMVTDIYMEWKEVEGGVADQLFSWEIDLVHSREHRAALAELEAFESTFGFPLQEFVEAVGAADRKQRTGPMPSPHTKNERITRRLKNAGRRISLGKVEHYRSLVEQYRPDLLPLPAADPAVVPFRKPNGREPH